MKNDQLGNRMKLYEGMEAGRRLLPLVPVCARIDGRSFHSFCKGLERPYDERLCKLMVLTCKHLVLETDAKVGYTQSDEISLVWFAEDWKSQIFFDGRIHKMTTQLAAIASVYFNRHMVEMIPEKATKMPTFDARVWNVPNLTEAANCLLWREQDATRNSISMAAQSKFSHNQLHNKNCKEMQEMLFQHHGVNWNDYPRHFKRGTYFMRRTLETPFTAEELSLLPPKHEAHKNPQLVIKRSTVVEVDLPPLSRIANREGVLFHGETPLDRVQACEEFEEETGVSGSTARSEP
jgi:tRNA(His) guanylyltransferase